MAPEGENVRFGSGGDVVGAGTRVEISAAVPGDVMMVGQDVTFTGSAGGSVLAAGGSQTIGGVVTGNVRSAGGAVVLTGEVERNVTLVGADVLLDREAEVALNAYLVGGRVELQGTVRGHLRVAAREVILDGPVTGNVDITASTLTVGPSTRIQGDLTYRVREGAASVDPAALVAGETVAVSVPGPSTTFQVVTSLGRVAGFLLAGVVLLLVVPPVAGTAVDLDHHPAAAVGLGLLWLVALPVLTFAAAVTVIGIPLAIISAVLYVVALYVAPVVPGLWLGTSLLDRPGAEPTHPARAFLLGGFLLGVAMLLPWVGFPIRLVAMAAGFGAVAVAIRDRLAKS
jgi:hypothetical protein